MFQSLNVLEKTLQEFEEKIGDSRVSIDDVFIWLEKYVRSVFGSSAGTKRGDDLVLPLEAAFNIAITLFELVDTGTEGVDDRMAEELKKIKARYMGS